jgi:hypothetical protein
VVAWKINIIAGRKGGGLRRDREWHERDCEIQRGSIEENYAKKEEGNAGEGAERS